MTIITTIYCRSASHGHKGAAAFVSQPIPCSEVATFSAHAIKFKRYQATTTVSSRTSKGSTSLFERRWNFNEGQGPWGLKKNAEVWNGRVAQVQKNFHSCQMPFFVLFRRFGSIALTVLFYCIGRR
jgi:hypothetical protein